MYKNRPSFLVTELVTNSKFMTIKTHFLFKQLQKKRWQMPDFL